MMSFQQPGTEYVHKVVASKEVNVSAREAVSYFGRRKDRLTGTISVVIFTKRKSLNV